jgi:hypothetical protein
MLIGSYRSFPCVGPGRNGWFLLHQFLLLRCEDMKAGALVRWRHKDSRIAEETLYLITKVRRSALRTDRYRRSCLPNSRKILFSFRENHRFRIFKTPSPER